MTKKKNMIARICGLLIVLTLISCCFLGTTFARYTSNVRGTASVTVAQWDIDVSVGENGQFAVNWNGNKLSPSQTGWDAEGATDQVQTNATGLAKVADITNGGDVNANVLLTYSETVTAIWINGTKYDATTWGNSGATYTYADIAKLFSIEFYADDSATAIPEDGLSVPAGEARAIYGEVTWTTDYTGITNAERAAAVDAMDTWVGENVTSVEWSVTLTAVQSSELPA